jgi:hypothetical protein
MIALNAGTESGADRQLQRAPWECGSRRLWSLWDIMQTFHPDLFIAIAHSLGTVQQDHEQRGKQKIDKDIRNENAKGFQSYTSIFDGLGLKISRLYTERILKEIQNDNFSSPNMVHACEELRNRMEDECKIRHFFSVSDDEQNYLESIGSIFSNAIINNCQRPAKIWMKRENAWP